MPVKKRAYKKKAPYKKRAVRRVRRAKVRYPKLTGSLTVPAMKPFKVSSLALFYAQTTAPQNSMIDVCLNDVHQPWAQTNAYNVSPFFVSGGTPVPTSNGFPNLAQWLGSTGTAFYMNYRVTHAALTVTLQAANVVDLGQFTLSPWTNYNTQVDAIPNTLYGAIDDPLTVTGNFNDDKSVTKTFKMSMARLFGVPQSTIKGDHQFQALANTFPVNLGYVRFIMAKGDAGALAGNVTIKMKLTLSGYMFNDSGSRAATVTV